MPDSQSWNMTGFISHIGFMLSNSTDIKEEKIRNCIRYFLSGDFAELKISLDSDVGKELKKLGNLRARKTDFENIVKKYGEKKPNKSIHKDEDEHIETISEVVILETLMSFDEMQQHSEYQNSLNHEEKVNFEKILYNHLIKHSLLLEISIFIKESLQEISLTEEEKQIPLKHLQECNEENCKDDAHKKFEKVEQ